MKKDDQRRLSLLEKATLGDYAAFLYDCDGTLADSMPKHLQCYVDVAATYGVSLDPSIVTEMAGCPVGKVVEEINRRYHCNFDVELFSKQKNELFYSKYLDQVLPIEFVTEHLKAHAGKVRIAVVSGGVRSVVSKMLEVIGVADLVEYTVCAGETPKGKPFPDPFLAAATYFDVAPEKCMVFEDGDSGIASAKAAGMSWVRIDQLS